MRQRELHRLQHHLEGIGTGRGPIHMLRRAVVSTIDQNKQEASQKEALWNEQSEWYTPNTLPTLNMAKALRTQSFKTVTSDMNRSPLVKNRFIISQQKMQNKSKKFAFARRGSADDQSSQGSQNPYRIQKHLDYQTLQKANIERADSLSRMKEKIAEEEITQLSEIKSIGKKSKRSGIRSSGRISGLQQGSKSPLKESPDKMNQQDLILEMPYEKSYDSDMSQLDEVEDKDYIDDLILNMPDEEQKVLGIFDLDSDLQRAIYVKQKNSELNKNKYLINDSPEKFCEYLDQKAYERRAVQEAMPPPLLQFIRKRLIRVLNLRELQAQSSHRDDSCIVCGVKQKIKMYLKAKDKRDVGFTKNPYRDDLLRKQLEYIDVTKGNQVFGENAQREELCTHFETIDKIQEMEEVFLEAYKVFLGLIPQQPITTKRDTIYNIALHFYHLEGLTEEEKLVYKNPKNFKTLLTSPWIRIVKDQGAEELGQDKYDDMRNPEPDEVFRQVQNLKVRKILKQIHQLYLEATEEEAQQESIDQFKDPKLIKTQEKFTSNQKPFDVETEVKNIKALAKDLRAVFKDLNIKKLVQRAPSRYSNPQGQKAPKYVPEEPTIETVLIPSTENEDYFELNKNNHNCCHPGEFDDESDGQPNEQQLQYNYHQASISKDRKLMTIPGLPVPSRVFNTQNGILHLKNQMRLENPNYLAIKEYIKAKRITQIILENNKNSDFQLKTMLEAVHHNNFQYFQVFKLSNGELGKNSIDTLCQIISYQQMTFGQLKQLHSKLGGWISRTNTNGSGHGQTSPPNQSSMNVSPKAAPSLDARKSAQPPISIPQPAVNKIQHLILDGIQILAVDARKMLGQLCETNIDTLLEVKFKNFNLNEDKTIQHLCNFLKNQSNLSILDLSFTSLRSSHLQALSDFFVESELAHNFVSLNLSYNNAICPSSEQQKLLTQSFCNMVQACEKIKFLFLTNMQMPDDVVLQISQRVMDSSQTLQVFHITHNSPSLPAAHSVGSESRKDLLKIFGVPFQGSTNDKSLDHPSKHFNVKSQQQHFQKSNQEDLIQFLINQAVSRESRKPVDFQYKVFDAPRETLKFQRNLQRNEMIFKNPGGFQEKALKHSFNLSWQVIEGGKCFKENEFPLLMFLFDRRIDSKTSFWEEIPKDEALLKRVHYQAHYDYGEMPFICYDGVVSPMIHGQMFTILAALNNNELFEETIPKGKEALVKFIRSLQKGYINLIQQKRKGAQKNVPEVKQALDEQYQVIAQKSEGWIEYFEQNLLDIGSGYYNQIVGNTEKMSEEKRPGSMCQDYFVYSTFLEPMAKQKTFILFDPKTDKMFRNRSIIQPQTAHFKQLQVQRLKQPSKAIPRFDGGFVFQSFKVDRRLKFKDEVFDLLDSLESWVSKIDSESRQIIAKFFRPLIDLQSFCLMQSMGQAMTEIKVPDKKAKKAVTGEQTQTHSIDSIKEDDDLEKIEVTPFVTEFNTALLSDFNKDERSDIPNTSDNKRFLEMEDFSKFDDLQTFIRSLLVVFKGRPKALFEFIVGHLLPIYKSQIQEPREALVNSQPLSQEIRELSMQPLKFLFYLELKLQGKVDFAFLERVFMSPSGLNWKATNFKNKKTMAYNTNQLVLDCMALSKLRQNSKITRQNFEGIHLDFDEFLMFICLIIQFMKTNQVCPKSWLEQNMEQIVPSIVNKIVFSVFKIKKPKVKKNVASEDLGDVFAASQEQAPEEDIVDSSDEDF